MKVTLERNVKNESVEVTMTIGKKEKRDDLYAVLLLHKSGPISYQKVNEKLLARDRESVVGKRVMANMEKLYRLVSWDSKKGGFTPTDLGKMALDTDGDVFIPERGVFCLFTTDDPLFPDRFVDIELVSTSHYTFDVWKAKRDLGRHEWEVRSNNKAERVQLEKWLTSILDKSMILPNKKHEDILIQSIDDMGAKSSRQRFPVISVTFEDGMAPTFRMNDGRERFPVNLSMEVEMYDAIRQMLGKNGKYLVEDNGMISYFVPFSETDEQSRNSFLMDIPLKVPSLDGYGSFKDTVIRSMPILPRTRDDAILWANSLLTAEITTYMDEGMYNKLREEVALRFPHQEGLSDELMDLEEAILNFSQSKDEAVRTRYWYLRTPRDLTMEGL